MLIKKSIKVNARAKINLGLDIVGKRSDGYHLLRTVMQTISLYDDVIVELKKGKPYQSTIEVFTDFDDSIPSDSDNLCIKAADVMTRDFDLQDSFSIKLYKHIPSQAGLGGGSADAAAVMRAIKKLTGVNVLPRDLETMAIRIGADVPFLIQGGTKFAEGIGEILNPMSPADLLPVLIVKPDFAINTGLAYKKYDEADIIAHPDMDFIRADLNRGGRNWPEKLGNVFYELMKDKYPGLSELIQEIKANGALGADMTGSGSACYGIFENEEVRDCALKAISENHKNYRLYSAFISKAEEDF